MASRTQVQIPQGIGNFVLLQKALLPQAPKNHLLILVLRCANASGSFELLHGSRVEQAKLDPAKGYRDELPLQAGLLKQF